MLLSASRKNPRRFHFLVAIVLAGLCTVGLWFLWGARPSWIWWLLSGSVAVNVVTFLYYGYDKWQAQRIGRRVPEAVLHGLAAVGGSPGAFVAMRFFRHKTVKGSFRILFWCIVALQAGLIAWIVYQALTKPEA